MLLVAVLVIVVVDAFDVSRLNKSRFDEELRITTCSTSFFGVFDGHGGSSCADFLRDNLHQYIIKDPNFPKNPTEALTKGFEAAETDFINNHALTEDEEMADRSGSCAVIAILVGNYFIIF